MKQLFYFLLIAFVCNSCVNSLINDSSEDENETKQVCFNLFTSEEKSLTRSENGTDNLLIIDVFGNTATNITPSGHTGDNTLSDINLHLKYGTHTLYFVVYSTTFKTLDLDNLTLTWAQDIGKLKQVYTIKKEITITKETLSKQNLVLQEVASLLEIKFTDVIPSNLAKIKLEITGLNWTLDLKTDKGINAGAYENTITDTNVSSIIGKTNISIYTYTLVPESGSVGNITITAYDNSDAVIKSKTISGVNVAKNKHITFSGDFFSNEAPFGLSVNSEWETENRNL